MISPANVWAWENPWSAGVAVCMLIAALVCAFGGSR